MSTPRAQVLAFLVLVAGCLLVINGLPRPPKDSDRIIFGHDEPPRVFPTTKPKVTEPDTKIIFKSDDGVGTTTLIDLANSTMYDNSTEFLTKGILPNCVNHGCPLEGYECDASSQTCREVLDV